ncbi:MAG: hypothetical protein KGQ36_03800 [Rickettsiales bacterium]|nr:hypothetical protein [Rickettsiales bacterium]
MSDIEIQKKEKIEKWPWTSDFLKEKRAELKFSVAQQDEVTKRALTKFGEIAKESKEVYSEEVRKKWEKEIEDKFLSEIVADVAKRPYWIADQSVVNGIFSSARSDKEREEEELKKKRAAQEMAANSSMAEKPADFAPKTEQGDKKQPPVAIASEVAVGTAATAAVAQDSMKDSKENGNKLTKFQVDELSSKFKPYGFFPGFPGGLRDRVRKMAEGATFAFDYKDKVVSNVNDDGTINLTFNGDCARRHYIEVSNNCYLAVDYNNKSGAVNIIKDALFFNNGTDQYSAMSLRPGSKDLEVTLGNDRDAKRVREKLSGIKLIACSNPGHVDGVASEDQPRRQVAAMMDGKTHGSKLTFGQKLALATGLLVVAAAAVLTGIGVVVGGAALVAAGGVAASAVAGGATTAASAVAGGATTAASAVAGGATTAASAVAVGTTTAAAEAVVIAKGIGAFATATANSIGSTVVHLTNNVVAAKTALPLSDINAKFDQVGHAITHTANTVADIIAASATHSADKVATGATHVADKVESAFVGGSGHASGSATSVKSIVNDIGSGIKDAANNKYTIPVLAGVGAGAAVASAGSAVAARNNDGAKKGK